MGVLTRPIAFMDAYSPPAGSLTVTYLTKGTQNIGGGSATFTTSAISPGANCLVVLMAGTQGYLGNEPFLATPTITSDASGPDTWVEVTRTSGPGTGNIVGTGIWYAVIGADPGSFAVTVACTPGEAIHIVAWSLHKVTGYHAFTPFGGKGSQASDTGNNGAKTLTLNAAPRTNDVTLAITWADSDSPGGATFDAGWTEDADLTGGASWGVGNVGQRPGSTSTSVSWTDINTADSSTTYAHSQSAAVVVQGGVASDDFNRADGALGANWTTATFQALNNAIIASNAASTAAAPQDSVSIYTGAGAFAADQFCEVDATLGSTASAVGVDVRAKVATASGYEGVWSDANGGQYTIWDYVSNAEVGTPVTGVGITGTRRLRIEAIGSTINFYVNGVLQVTATDTSTTGTGNDTYPGLFLAVTSGSVPVADNFLAGG